MNWTDLKLRLRALLSPRRSERELHEELAFHIDREVEKLVQSGIARDEAKMKAHARFGSVTVAADHCRDQRRIGVIDQTMRDVHYALRSFRRTPVASITIVATVAIGLGLVTAVFTFFSALLFNVDAVRNPHELVEVMRRQAGNGEQVQFTLAEYEALGRETDVFSESVAWAGTGVRVDGRLMIGALVSPNYFQSLGAGAARGRVLTPADGTDAGAPVIVLSHAAWTRWFASDPAIVGRRVRIHGNAFEVVGVAHEGFRGLSIAAPGFWAPLEQIGHFQPTPRDRRSQVKVSIVGRLAPQTSPVAAVAGLRVWATAAEQRANATQATITLEPRQGTVSDAAGDVMLIFTPLFFSFGLVLLIGCANASNLLLARGLARQRELGIRLAIGASRGRIVRQLLIESLLLALVSSACGLLLSRIILNTLVYIFTATLPFELIIPEVAVPTIDWRVIVFQLITAVIATALFGFVPALHSTRLELVRTMRGEVARDGRPGRARGMLIAIQVAASALLLISAGVFLRSSQATAAGDTGVRTADTLTVKVATESQRAAVIRALADHPSIVTIAGARPNAFEPARAGHGDADAADAAARHRVAVGYRYVTGEYFRALDIPILQGRAFTAAERQVESGVVVVSATAARELWPSGSALGKTVRLQLAEKASGQAPVEAQLPTQPFTVIGVVDDVRARRLRGQTVATIYLPTDEFAPDTKLILRAHGNPDVVRMQLFQRLTAIDPDLESIVTFRMISSFETFVLNGAFAMTIGLAALALVLTVSGLFGVVSYVVAQRTREIGVRVALGATPRGVNRLIVTEMLRQIGLGLAAGTGLAVAVTVALLATPAASVVGDTVHVTDPVPYVVGAITILTACLVAAWIPASRASRIDPIATLRED